LVLSVLQYQYQFGNHGFRLSFSAVEMMHVELSTLPDMNVWIQSHS
jgi:hypothetical protein